MALPLWVVAKISLKVGCTYASKLASKSLLGPLGKAVLSSPIMGKVFGRLTRYGLESGVGRLLGANSLFLNRGPFDYTTWTHDETIAATIAVEVAEAKGPGERAKFAMLRVLSPALRYRLKLFRRAIEDGSLHPNSLRAKLLSLFEPMPVCPHFTRDHPDAVAQIMSDYLAHQAHGKGLGNKLERYKWQKLLRAIDRLENFEFVKLVQILHKWQTPHLFTRERNERRSNRRGKAARLHLNYLPSSSPYAPSSPLLTSTSSSPSLSSHPPSTTQKNN